MVNVADDPLSGYSELTVRAFKPEDAKVIADRILQLSEELVNKMFERSCADSVSLAKKEADMAYTRLSKARGSLQAFQQRNKQIDPYGYAESNVQIQAALQENISSCRTQLDVLRKNLSEDAPAVIEYETRIASFEKQLAAEKAQATSSPNRDSALEILTNSDDLRSEYDFDEKAYLNALGALEAAQMAAMRQFRYLEPFVRPQLPQYSEYPRRIRDVILTACVASLLWGTMRLFTAAAKEHL